MVKVVRSKAVAVAMAEIHESAVAAAVALIWLPLWRSDRCVKLSGDGALEYDAKGVVGGVKVTVEGQWSGG